MEFIRSFWASQPTSPTFEGDEVYSVHLLDNLKLFDSFLMTTTWFYNDVLDTEKIHHSLTRLLEVGDWKKLGGRYRRPDGRNLKLYVPQKYTAERPAVSFSSDTFSTKVRDHPNCANLPKTMPGGLFHPQLKLKDLAHRPGGPKTLLDLLEGDQPALSLRIITFEDATLVTLIWPHAMMDAKGLGALVHAWSTVLADSGLPIPELTGARHDLIRELASSTDAYDESSEVEKKRLAGFEQLAFVLRLLKDKFWGPKKEEGVIHISKEAAEGLRSRALEELIDKPNPGKEAPWISQHDVLASVWIKSLALSGSRPAPVTLRLPFDIRTRLPGTLEPDGCYVQNLVLPACCTITEALAAGPLGQIALTIRQTLQRQTTMPQILASLRSKCEDQDANYNSMEIPGPLSSTLLSITDWSRAGFFQAPDFGPVVIRQDEKDEERDGVAGIPFYFLVDAVYDSELMTGLMNLVVHLGKDQQGGHWFMATLPPRAWKLVRQNVELCSR